eukprot:scaffold78656_cov48-Phaeocystis_antarctica.AAC.2
MAHAVHLTPSELQVCVARGTAAWSECPAWQCPSSAPVPPQGAPGGSGQLSTPRTRPAHCASSISPRP